MPRERRVALMIGVEWPHRRHADVFAGVYRYAAEQGWKLIVDEYVTNSLGNRPSKSGIYDGVIGRATMKLATCAAKLNLPVVNVWMSSPAMHKLPGVFPDFAAAGKLRAEHLLDRGLRRFAALGRNDRGVTLEVAAFRKAIADAGGHCVTAQLPLHPTRTCTSWKASERTINAMMDTWKLPIGVFVGVDEVGRFVAQMCNQRGWRVPQDVAIIAGYNEQTLCEYPRPALSSLEMGYQRVGYEAGRLLDGLMASVGRNRMPSTPPPHVYVPPSHVVVRDSTDFFMVEDRVVADAIAFISSHSTRDIGQADVARAVFSEVRTLQSRFRKALGRPIAATIRLLRLERAKRELLDGDRTMKEVARRAGFRTAANMKNCFRKELGMTASDYRRQRQLGRGKAAPRRTS